ncbi:MULTISPECIES: isocitrate lyase/phosphoenolpyruvate mutase family protein [unclassified Curtobacterium]|uniref:isocitrate lyase/PEP mutase family protein n=1 Tax=unclassified Curtobacterium TaxID=257496 RepID=UPI000DA71171|nr:MULTISPECIES: isocitrate lyase/phosphoenolpyruvate mutase family protein [unclassified Curtobacterium]PZE68449.1 isocitrate lyase/phosphoenolpyruvate mutase family protein [Curtobacterium sp. MCLR17_059]PZF22651.1 isocitrate lyase/phosphoenolpyruvate mutase family protein [Curtobacterium sp. MCLR17_045]PZF48585.1 isocitrate lyase/phosphoenolpyruvate mutase family protein [Curtobacterium sp. MCLR17_057]
MNTTSTRAATFHGLHDHRSRPLVLVNVWDAASARLVEDAGATAIATTSAGVAWSLGRPDGNTLTRAEAMDAVARIAASVSVPITVDIESGYADDADGVARTVDAVLEAGAVGINIEDGRLHPDALADRIGAARRAAERAGVPLFVNARTDVHLAGLVDPERLLAETLERARRYRGAGADGVFVPGVRDVETIRALVESIDGPVNVMAGPGSPTVAELARLGVARISLGSAVAQAAYAVVRQATAELRTTGTYDSLAGGVDYADLNALF